MTNETQQTPVEKLFHKLWDTPKDKFTWYALLKEAKELEKEGMISFTQEYIYDELWVNCNTIESDSTVEQYYNETYGGNK